MFQKSVLKVGQQYYILTGSYNVYYYYVPVSCQLSKVGKL